MQVIVIASEQMYHCLNPFMYLWNKYADFNYFDVTVCLFGQTDFIYRPHCKVRSVGNQADWPLSDWSSKLRYILNSWAEDQFILMLEDYWVTRHVDARAVKMLFDYAAQFQNVLKIDLATDRLYINGGANFLYGKDTYAHLNYLDLLKSPHGTQYQMSLWGGIWNRDQLMRVLIPGETPQQLELSGTGRVTSDQLVLGTRQAPMVHGNIYQSRHNGEPVYRDTGWRVNDTDLTFMRGRGWIP
ncbi:MAG: hypothetical protein GY743_23245 [Planctomycetaceae bacterium]|nr:hypothetical protein [Planctomycetaceae bacterium]